MSDRDSGPKRPDGGGGVKATPFEAGAQLVSTSFGQTALIRMRWRAWSIPMHCVSDASAAFVMQ